MGFIAFRRGFDQVRKTLPPGFEHLVLASFNSLRRSAQTGSVLRFVCDQPTIRSAARPAASKRHTAGDGQVSFFKEHTLGYCAERIYPICVHLSTNACGDFSVAIRRSSQLYETEALLLQRAG